MRSNPFHIWLVLLALHATEPAAHPQPELDGTDVLVRRVLEDARAAVASDSDDAGAWAHLGAVYQAHSFWRPSAEALAQALAHSPDGSERPKWLYWQALALFESGDYDTATSVLRRVTQSQPGYKPARWRLGDWLLEAGDLAAAESIYRQLIAERESDPVARTGLGTTLLQLGQSAAAARELRLALRYDPTNRYAALILGRALTGIGEHKLARRLLARNLGATRSYSDPWRSEVTNLKAGLGAKTDQAHRLNRAGRSAEAAELLAPLVDLYPGYPLLLNKLAEIELTRGDTAKALDWLAQASELDENLALTEVHIAQAYRDLDDLATALEHAEAAATADPSFWPAHMELSTILRQQGDVEASLDALTRALGLGFQGDPDLWLQLGFGRLALKQIERAEQAFAQAARRFPYSARAFAGLALARAEQGNRAGAEEALAEAIEIDPNDRLILQAKERIRLIAAEDL